MAVVGAHEAPAPALGDEHDEIGERLTEAEDGHGGTRLQHREVLVGGVARREVGQLVARGEVAVGGTGRIRLGVEVPQREDDHVDLQGRHPAIEHDPLAAAPGLGAISPGACAGSATSWTSIARRAWATTSTPAGNPPSTRRWNHSR